MTQASESHAWETTALLEVKGIFAAWHFAMEYKNSTSLLHKLKMLLLILINIDLCRTTKLHQIKLTPSHHFYGCIFLPKVITYKVDK